MLLEIPALILLIIFVFIVVVIIAAAVLAVLAKRKVTQMNTSSAEDIDPSKEEKERQ